MKLITNIRKNAHWIAIGIGVLILSMSLFSDKDLPKAFAIDYATVNRSISPEELANLYMQNKQDFEVLDLRSTESYNRGHIKNAISCPACHTDKADAKEKQKDMPDFNKKFILYTETGKEAVKLPRIMAKHTSLYLLSGGYEAFENTILRPQVISEEDTEEVVLYKKKMNAVYNYFTGKEQVAPPTGSEQKTIKRRASHTLGKSEGC